MHRFFTKKNFLIFLSALFLFVIIFFFSKVFSKIISAITPLFIALIISYILNPIVCFLEKNKLPRILAIFLIYLIIISIIVLFLWLLVPKLISNLKELSKFLPEYTEKLKTYTEGFASSILGKSFSPEIKLEISKNIFLLQNILTDKIKNLGSMFLGTMNVLIDLSLGFVLAFYIMLDIEMFKRSFINLVPRKNRSHLWSYINDIDSVLSGFIRGQLTIALILSIMLAIGFSLIGLNYAIILGFVGGMFDIIPYFGPIIGIIPAILVAFLQQPIKALFVLIIFLICQQIEGAYLSPKIVGKRVGLHPVATLVAVLIGAKLFGTLGLLLAVPFFGIIKVIILRVISHFSD